MLYIGSTFRITSSLYFRVSQHLKANHCLRNSGNLLYPYNDGRSDAPRDVFVVALARFPRDMSEDSVIRQTNIDNIHEIQPDLLSHVLAWVDTEEMMLIF